MEYNSNSSLAQRGSPDGVFGGKAAEQFCTPAGEKIDGR